MTQKCDITLESLLKHFSTMFFVQKWEKNLKELRSEYFMKKKVSHTVEKHLFIIFSTVLVMLLLVKYSDHWA